MLTQNNKNIHLRSILYISLFVLISVSIFAEKVELNIIYTNDIHDHVRPGYMGVGGLPYIAGFVNKIRAESPNVLLVDAGDLTDKGDMVADLTDGEITYRAIEMMKYDAMVIGNHDYDKGIERLCKLKELAPSVEFVGTNYKEGLDKCHKPWVIKKLGNTSIGFVGVVKLSGDEIKVAKESVPELTKAVEELKSQGCHLIIALFHLGSNACDFVSKDIPEISVFISGHTHELLKEARIQKETQAIIVQAGSYAMWAGHLKLIFDTEQKKVIRYENQVVEMKHDEIKPDEEIMNLIISEEKRVCPIASEFIINNEKTISTHQIGVLAANAIKEKSGSDIALFHPRLLVRSTFPPTKLDYNAVFLTAGSRAKELVEVTLTGRQIEQYLIDLVKHNWSRTEWAGINAEYERTFPLDKVSIKTDLVSEKQYKVALAKMEFENRLLRSLQKNEGNNIDEIKAGVKKCDFNYFEAVSEYIEKIHKQGLTLSEYVSKMKITNSDEKEEKEYETEQ